MGILNGKSASLAETIEGVTTSNMNREYDPNTNVNTSGFSLCDYYHLSDKSITSLSGDTRELYGSKTGVKHNLIKGFMLMNNVRNEVSKENNEETGDEYTLDKTADVIHGTIKPSEGDMIIFKNTPDVIFKVNNVELVVVNNVNRYRISYDVIDSSVTRDEINVDKEYLFDYESRSTTYSGILVEDDYLLKHKVEKMIAKAIKLYKKFYYDEKANTYIYPNDGFPEYYSPVIKYVVSGSYLLEDTYIFDEAEVKHKPDEDSDFFIELEEEELDDVEPMELYVSLSPVPTFSRLHDCQISPKIYIEQKSIYDSGEPNFTYDINEDDSDDISLQIVKAYKEGSLRGCLSGMAKNSKITKCLTSHLLTPYMIDILVNFCQSLSEKNLWVGDSVHSKGGEF